MIFNRFSTHSDHPMKHATKARALSITIEGNKRLQVYTARLASEEKALLILALLNRSTQFPHNRPDQQTSLDWQMTRTDGNLYVFFHIDS